jgi:hypothetical protein
MLYPRYTVYEERVETMEAEGSVDELLDGAKINLKNG